MWQQACVCVEGGVLHINKREGQRDASCFVHGTPDFVCFFPHFMLLSAQTGRHAVTLFDSKNCVHQKCSCFAFSTRSGTF